MTVNTQEIQENSAQVLISSDVFYNPVQEFNRDLSIAVIKTWSRIFRAEGRHKELRCLEALSATGLRSIRYSLEMPDVFKTIIANDMDISAVEMMKKNIDRNNVTNVIPNCADACDVMYSNRRDKFHCIDLDPYGSASQFLDAAVQSIADGGLLCITCTDMAVLSGKYSETAFSKYGGSPLRAQFCHEMALRLVLNATQASASRYKRKIIPLLSCSIDFYVRVFVKVITSPVKVKETASNTSIVLNCSNCGSYALSPFGVISEHGDLMKYHIGRPPMLNRTCNFCEGPVHMGGPVYGGKLYDDEFVSILLTHIKESDDKIYKTHQRMLGMVTVVSEELHQPLYYTISYLSKVLHCQTPSMVKLFSAFLNAGYKISMSHCNSNSFKTDAPPQAIWDILRGWVKLNPVKFSESENSASFKILSKETEMVHVVDFNLHPDANPVSRKIKLTRFESHKGMDWGPKARAGKKKRVFEELEQ
jgi:tRNA (guanine26-N2/guanine27-N2)-dimethyltransferase